MQTPNVLHVEAQRRLYTVEELAAIFDSLGLRLNEVFGANGRPWKADAAEPEIYVEARG
jgi:hypothetical protein